MTFELQPTHLRGDLVELRPLRPTDFEALYAVAADPLIWEQHPENTRHRRDVFEKFFQGAVESKGAFTVIDVKTGEVMGSSRYCFPNPEKNQIEIGYTFLARKYWGQGHNKEMKRLMLNHAFQYVARVVFFIGENNKRSRKAIEQIGAHLIERIQRQPKQGQEYNAVLYAISKDRHHLSTE